MKTRLLLLIFVLIIASPIVSKMTIEIVTFKDYLMEHYSKKLSEDIIIKCSNTIYEYEKECIPVNRESFSSTKIDSECKRLASENCKNFFKDIKGSLIDCEKVPEKDLNKIINYFKESNELIEMYCTKNENNEYCPLHKLKNFSGLSIVEYFSQNSPFKDDVSDKDVNNVIYEICKSKKCYDSITKYNILFESIEYENDTEEIIKNISSNFGLYKEIHEFSYFQYLRFRTIVTDILKSEQCKALVKISESSGKVASKAFPNQIGIGFLIATLSLFLVFINAD
ncbi:hypothetical protein BCR32DRAFT_304612 [Anaeromyces robustus]|uniref:Uncharacterized protein n=1 Tax=Anaeromyces robustus TaxID=1754192 RepID=A0A1Y1WQK0_9FUNG|nr:hypothetical protein BCR32DRAFT_304612 [Anaeromyces robustus]|eukprot:ORX75665.1 hypothetical protein BCR32DRAFT_304612 [Anaeromyces robustus]